MGLDIICPYCRERLTVTKRAESIKCVFCERCYPVESGVIRILEQDDEFYEGSYENQVRYTPRSERPWHVWPLWLINSGYPWMVRRHVPPGSVVVELGCAGGVRYFGSRYRMIGCDLSYSALRSLETIYEVCIQADAARCLPLPDNSVDAVVSSYFWEHIPPDAKLPILDEINRILRPGGKLIFLYDVKTENPLICHFKQKDPELYNRLFIEGDGHFGYQLPMENIALFKAAGFQVVKHRGDEKTLLQSPSAYTKLAQIGVGNPLLAGLARTLQKSPLFYFYTALMRLTDIIICPLLPIKWARIDLTVCEKRVL